MPNSSLDCAGKPLDLSSPVVMGILNVTPDSFSDGGRFMGVEGAVEQALVMAREGAGIIDIGGESTRPGAPAVTEKEELARVIPVIEALRTCLSVPISIDTQKPAVMRAAVKAGAGMINDVNALGMSGALEMARDSGVPVCLMHRQGDPLSMQRAPSYQDVVQEVGDFLVQRATRCIQAGIVRERILLDPGFGFGKSVSHNLQLLQRLDELVAKGFPVLVGLSRKSMIGKLLGLDVEQRLHPGVALAVLAVWQGASVIRTHDVRPTVEAIAMCAAVMRGNEECG